MEERNILETIEDISRIFAEVKNYIINTENYIFYWMSNKELQDYMQEYPDDFEDRISLSINSISGNSVTVTISFNDEHPHNVERIQRYCTLSTFRDSVKARYAEFSGSLIEHKLKEAEEELEYYKKMVIETENEIKELKKKISE